MRRITEAEVIARLKANNPNCRLVSEYVRITARGNFKCRKCKHEWSTTVEAVANGVSGCPQCAKPEVIHNKRGHDEYIVKLAEKNPELECLDEYNGSFGHLTHRHTTCGYEWQLTPANALKGRGCPKCKTRLKQATLGQRTVHVRGYESQALKWITKHSNVRPQDITVDTEATMPTFTYTLYGTTRRYFPDFYVKRFNMIVEVKSLSTVGLLGNLYNEDPRKLYYITRAKARAVIASGFRFMLMLMNENGTRVKVPDDWTTMTHAQFTSQILAG